MNTCRLCERKAVSVTSESPVCAWCIRLYLTPMAARHGMSVEDAVALTVLADDTLVDRTVKQVEEESA